MRCIALIKFKGEHYMKYKILVSGNNSALVTDFIKHAEPFFKLLSTTVCKNDVLGHFELFKPDAYVCFMNYVHGNILPHIRNLRDDPVYNGASVILVCDSETIEEIRKNPDYMVGAELLVERPISVNNLVLKITRFLEELNELREQHKSRKEIIAAKVAEEAAAAALAAKSAGRKHILVIDDDRVVLKMLKTALSEKYDVTTMVNGAAMERFLESKNVDLIVLDYEMPGETGADLFRKIKNNPKISHIPVVFLTGVSEKEKIMEVMALKPHGYLLKPIDMEMLFAAIANLTN